MHQMRFARGRQLSAVVALSVLTTLGVAACGGSSGSSTASTHTNAAATSTAAGGTAAAKNGTSTPTGANAKGGGTARPRFTAVRECLSKQGIKLPAPSGRGGLFLGGANLPKGVSRSQLQAATRKCLGGRAGFLGGPGTARLRRTASPRFRQALSSFAACLRKNGVNVPAPNTSGNGPVFSTKGIDTSSPQFKAATAKCRSALVGAFRSRGGTAGGPGPAASSVR